MKYLLSAILLGLSFAPLAAQADDLPDGQHFVDYCISIKNVAAFPDYQFYLNGHGRRGFPVTLEIGATPECLQYEDGTFIAVKKVDISKLDTTATDTEDEGNWPSKPANSPYIIWTKTAVPFDVLVPDVNPVITKNYIYEIAAVEGGLTVYPQSVISLDKNGKVITEETTPAPAAAPKPEAVIEPVQDPTVTPVFVAPPPAKAKTTASPMALVWIVLVCGGAVAIALAIKTWKK